MRTEKIERETAIFKFFETKMPNFAGRKISWIPGSDPPDILCTDEPGLRIGVELGEWLNEAQMKVSQIREGVEESYRAAIRSRETQHPTNVGMVHSGAKDAIRISAEDAPKFREEIYELVAHVNRDWPLKDPHYDDFSGHPTLAKYLHHLDFDPVSRMDPILSHGPWICTVGREEIGAFSY